ncbi:glycosyl hydrolase family 18 protein [Streptomyces indicus]|uniref:Spore germination protein YaaH n=1 Tax=Streptomyces indicus TaxID=417292 RepID=A0A1G8TWM4_9ACTN|nr:glycosyl hydrolase family 18 protein [Streptomyces indicus]SDJ45976.1 Spore germination protein YaaH [Streptomyces indicus]
MSARTVLAAAALLLTLAAAPPAPPDTDTGAGAAGTDREAAPPPRTVSGWLPYWDQEAAYATALRHKDQLHTVSPFWYEAKADGSVLPHRGAGDRKVIDGLREAGIKVVPTVHERMAPGRLAALVTDPERRTAHVDALVRTVRSRAYDGIDIDYETHAPTPEAEYRRVRAGYAEFITALCRRLHADRKLCVTTVSPQARGNGRIWDYRRLGAASDRLRIMAYNLHWAGGEPGPISSPDWYEDILAHATRLVPREKIEMALPAYGWDWPVAGSGKRERARHVTSKSGEELRRKVGARYRLDPASKTPHFTYTEGTGAAKRRREVWYQDARGTAAHLPVLRKYGVRHTAIWALNFEDPALWRTLARG